jgi:Tfp pilus assembly protein PilN
MRHLNLLPLERKAVLRKELGIAAALRITLNIFWVILSVTLVGVSLWGVIWMMDWRREETADVLLVKQVREYNEWRNAVTSQNTLLHAIDNLGETRVLWSQVIASLLKTVPPGTSVVTLTAEMRAGEAILSIAGQAQTRNVLVLFEERLRELPWVREVEAPRKNLLKRINADYEFKLYLDVKEAKSYDKGVNVIPYGD